MDLYKIAEPGREAASFDPDGDEIRLGESGRGRQEAVVPITGEGNQWGAKRVEDQIVLVRREADEDRCLVVINAVGGYSKNRQYGIKQDTGLTILTKGVKAFGQAGRNGGGIVALAIAKPGAEFRLRSKYARHWHRWDGAGWKLESPSERDARRAVNQLKEEEGEWL